MLRRGPLYTVSSEGLAARLPTLEQDQPATNTYIHLCDLRIFIISERDSLEHLSHSRASSDSSSMPRLTDADNGGAYIEREYQHVSSGSSPNYSPLPSTISDDSVKEYRLHNLDEDQINSVQYGHQLCEMAISPSGDGRAFGWRTPQEVREANLRWRASLVPPSLWSSRGP